MMNYTIGKGMSGWQALMHVKRVYGIIPLEPAIDLADTNPLPHNRMSIR
jgi:hypothetical protein